jgi:hypothetical protein
MVASLGRWGRKRREKIRQKEGDNEGEEGRKKYERRKEAGDPCFTHAGGIGPVRRLPGG